MSSKPAERRPWSLSARLTAWYAGSVFVLILIAGAFLYWSVFDNLNREDDEEIADRIVVLRELLRNRPLDAPEVKQEAEWETSIGPDAKVFIRILDASGRVAVETPGMARALPSAAFPVSPGSETGSSPGADLRSKDERSFRIMTGTARSREGPCVIQVAMDRTHEEDVLAASRRTLLGVLAAALVVGACFGYFIARRGIRPIEEMARAADRIRSTTLHERIDAAGLPAELAALGGTFNQMLDRLQDSFGRLSRFSADLAHELRTPINNLSGEIEVALAKSRTAEEYRKSLESALEECARLSRLVEKLLFLAKAENPATQISLERVDVGGELRNLRDFFGAAAGEAGVTLDLQSEGSLETNLERTLFQRALGNLIENALAHTPSGGRIALEAGRRNGGIAVTVADTGTGILPEHLPHVFERFFRADGARTAKSGGAGLGLAIVT
ncbi:MAG TPA: heavy metal sensor histidine kinase, partial [Planctomycetota bacterium]|nr:heavy metal sensor histidine kinase [Planctomycetota bacterium]